MSKTVVLICILFVAALTLASAGLSPTAASPGVEASGTSVQATTYEARTALDADASLWMRLRWIFAGVSLAAIVLVTTRQLRQFVTPDPARFQERPMGSYPASPSGGD